MFLLILQQVHDEILQQVHDKVTREHSIEKQMTL